jgi:hypothetical protein
MVLASISNLPFWQWGGRVEVVRVARRDLWSNVRIRFLHSLPTYNASSFHWLDIVSDIIPKHSSLIGIPVRGLPSASSGNLSFVLNTNYQILDVSLSIVYERADTGLTVLSTSNG